MRDTYHHGNLAAELLRLGELEIAAAGLHQFGLRELARKAGVSNAAAFRHFENKDHLIREIAAEGFRVLLARLRDGDSLSPEARLRWGFATYLTFAVDRPGCLRAMFGGILERSPPDSAAMTLSTQAFSWLASSVEAARQAGVLSRGGPRTALVFFSALHGAAILNLEMRAFPEVGKPTAAELAELLFETLARPSAADS